MKRKLIKVSMIFLLLMVLFTILSRAAYNLGTAVVKTQMPSAAEIGPVIMAQGTVKEKQDAAVVTEANQLVKTVYVTEGQSVEKGQVLFNLDMKDLDEQLRKKNQALGLANLQLQSAQTALQTADDSRQFTLKQAQADYDHASEQGDAAVQQAEQELNQAKDNYQQFQDHPDDHPDQFADALSQEVQGKQEAYDGAVKSRDDSLYESQKAIDAANAAPQQDTAPVEQAKVTKEQAEEEVKKLQVLKDAKGEIKAPMKSIVAGVNLKPGSKTSDGGDILLADVSAGTKLTAVFPEEAKKYIQRGEAVKVISSGGAALDQEDKLSNLKIDAVSNGTKEEKGITVTVNVPAQALDMGASVSVEVASAAKSYDTCVPLSALNLGDKGKYYVNVAEKTKSILGEGLIVSRVKVEVLDKNDKLAAVDGITNAQDIIIESSKMLADKMHVKRKEE